MIRQLVRGKLDSVKVGEDIPFTTDERRLVLRELNWHNSTDSEFLYDMIKSFKEPILIPYDFVFHLDELLKD